ncbi:MAG: preprotein translocase subunit SecA [Paraglaciecola psychrophila]|jgi:preprotein translocase subunit SecA
MQYRRAVLSQTTPAVRPGTRHGMYPLGIATEQPWLEQRLRNGLLHLDNIANRRDAATTLLAATGKLCKPMYALGESQLQREIADIRRALNSGVYNREILHRCFAIIRELARRRLGTAHFDVQLLGGLAILQGQIAEMATGEGKTLTATLAAATAALAGIPVHIVTANDYLAERDAQSMWPLYHALGLSVGVIQPQQAPVARREAYACDITYCSNKQVAFDYLKDSLVLKGRGRQLDLKLLTLTDPDFDPAQLLLRGLCFAIVDEADSVLIDEARTPLLLSQTLTDTQADQLELSRVALAVATELTVNTDFTVDHKRKSIELSDNGLHYLEQTTQRYRDNNLWRSPRRRRLAVEQALQAINCFFIDQHYVLLQGNIEIVDPHTGRLLPGRSWEYSLQLLIELKEGCQPSPPRQTLAQISYQRFFQGYHCLGGMTGTAREVRAELVQTYGLITQCIPANRPCRRQYWSDQLLANSHLQSAAIVDRCRQMQRAGRPVLIGTRSVERSEQLSHDLNRRGLQHQLLNARQDRDEANIIAKAGRAGMITIATNMAGRGTDIVLDARTVALGGLHVIICHYSRARRLDRQLAGRCARQGDPGSCEFILCASHETQGVFSMLTLTGLLRYISNSRYTGIALTKVLLRQRQKSEEKYDYQQRQALLRADSAMQKKTAYAGPRD